MQGLNQEQELRLEEFRAQFGATWRHHLFNQWLTGDDLRQPQGHILREIRALVYQDLVTLPD